MKSRIVIFYLQHLECCPFCYKVTSTGPIMTGQKDVKDLLFPYTSSQDLIWANIEQIAPNPGEGGNFPNYLTFLSGGQLWWELC